MFILKRKQKGHPAPFFIEAVGNLTIRVGSKASQAQVFETREEAEEALKNPFLKAFEIVPLKGEVKDE